LIRRRRKWGSDDPVLLQNGLLIPRYPSKDLWRVFKMLHQIMDLKINGNIRFAAPVVDGGPSDVRQAVVLVDRRDTDITKSHVLRTDSPIIFESLLHHLLQVLVIPADTDASRRRSDERSGV